MGFCSTALCFPRKVASEDGMYVIYTIKQMADDLDRSERTVWKTTVELENAGLITRVQRQGWNYRTASSANPG